MERLVLGVRRIQSVLDREEAAGIRTLEMKISDGGPEGLRVEPHILGLAGMELVERGFVKAHKRKESGTHSWYAPARLSDEQVDTKLAVVLPAYLETTKPSFTSGLGDPLEIGIFKILRQFREENRKAIYFGSYDLTERNASLRYPKTEPPTSVCDTDMHGPPDFVQIHPLTGEPLLIECKNLREWLYPSSEEIKGMIRKAITADMTPLLIARRIPYITKVALCAPAGIIAHETYHQLYPETPYGRDLASRVNKKRGLGYSDVISSEDPLPRTMNFFQNNLPKIIEEASARFQKNKDMLRRWADSEVSWRDLRLHLSSDYPYPDIDMDF